MSYETSIGIVMAGVGGQGIILASRILGEAALEAGLNVRIGETHGLAQRGGSVVNHIKIGKGVFSPLIPEGQADALVSLEPLEALRYVDLLKPNATVIVNERGVPPITVEIGMEDYPPASSLISALRRITPNVYSFDAGKIAVEAGNVHAVNIVLLGALYAVINLPFSVDSLKACIRRCVPSGTEEVNIRAFDLGYELAKGMKKIKKGI